MQLQRGVVAVVLSGLLVALTPLAQATPPDPTWIAGLYDDADYDDVVLRVTGADSAVQLDTLPQLVPISIVFALVPALPQALPGSPQLSVPSRAPPLG